MKTPLRFCSLRLTSGTIFLLLVFFWFAQSFALAQTAKWRVVLVVTADGKVSAPERPSGETRTPILEAVSFASGVNGWIASDDGTVLRTTDGGTNWVTTSAGIGLHLSAIHFLTNELGWAGGNARGQAVVLRTVDGGGSWQSDSAPLSGFESSSVHDICFIDGQHGWAVGEAQKQGLVLGIIIASTDGGVHWQVQHAQRGSTYLHAVRFLDRRHGWAIGDGTILKTGDAGRHWRTVQELQGIQLSGIDLVDERHGWIVGSWGTVLSTDDGGKTWRRVHVPHEQKDLWLSSVRFSTPSVGWIAGDNGVILSTEDAGKTWTIETAHQTDLVRALAITSSSVLAVGNGGVVLARPLPARTAGQKGNANPNDCCAMHESVYISN